jgi:HSP20 family protein
MRREMDRLWDSFFERRPGREEVEWLPALDVSETKDEIVVKAEVPGMEAKDIDISLSGLVRSHRHEYPGRAENRLRGISERDVHQTWEV